MASVAHLDTHVVVWLWTKDMRRLKPMKRTLEERQLVVSPAVELELQFLVEIGRLRDSPPVICAGLRETIALQRSSASFGDIVEKARALGWTRDPIDRLIVGTAIVEGHELLTRDENILANFGQARRS
ncbi:MAG: PIN domain-containing protein [Deltaproteobacteria bacterium]|nr:PIN domain-containing protein [Deltaproteobacteria bacterium]